MDPTPAPPQGAVTEVVPPQVEQQTPPPSGKFSLSPKIIFALLAILIVVIIGSGIYLNQSSAPKETAKATPTPTSKPEPTKDPTASWKTYNDVLAFSFSYPSDWEIARDIDDPGIIQIDIGPTDRDVAPITLAIYFNTNNLPKDQFDKSINNHNCLLYLPEDQKKVLPSGITVFYREKGFCEPLETRLYMWEDGGSFYQLRSKNYQPVPHQDEIVSKILHSFKFKYNMPLSSPYSIVSKSKTSPNGSFAITDELIPDYRKISVKDSKGNLITDDLITKNRDKLGYKDFSGQWGASFKGWIDDEKFVLTVEDALGYKYEYLVDAATATVNESSAKRIK